MQVENPSFNISPFCPQLCPSLQTQCDCLSRHTPTHTYSERLTESIRELMSKRTMQKLTTQSQRTTHLNQGNYDNRASHYSPTHSESATDITSLETYSYKQIRWRKQEADTFKTFSFGQFSCLSLCLCVRWEVQERVAWGHSGHRSRHSQTHNSQTLRLICKKKKRLFLWIIK